MSAQQQALQVLANAQSMPLQPPSGEQTCPLGRIRIGVFFDGTGNNMWRDWGNGESDRTLNWDVKEGKYEGFNGPTNVAKLFKIYKEPALPTLNKIYHHGVGSDYDYDEKTPVGPPAGSSNPAPVADLHGNGMGGGGFGRGGKARIEWGLKQLAEFFSNTGNNLIAPEKFFDVFGFSRGAALARDFVNAVKTSGVENLKGEVTVEYVEIPGSMEFPGGVVRVEHRPRVNARTITPKFMGIFDTVASFGLGGLQVGNDIGQFKLDVDHTYVEYVVHLVAEDEFRGNFPLSSIFMDPNDKNSWFASTRNKYQDPRKFKKWMLEIWYPGAHSDIGGSYLKRGMKPGRDAYTQTYVSPYGPVQTVQIPATPPTPGKRHEMANITLQDMYKAMEKCQVPVDAMSKIPAVMTVIPGDLASAYNEYCAFRRGTDYAQLTERGDSRYIQSWEDSEYRKRFYTATTYEDWLQPWNWHRSSGTARESQECVKTLMNWVHDSSAEFSTTAWIERPGGARVRLQRTVLYADAQPIPEARNYPLPQPGR